MAACSVEELLAKAEQEEAEKLKSITVQKELDLEFDTGNLLACDKNRIELRDLKGQKKQDFFRSLARDNTQLLINEIFKLPTETVEGTIVAKLPDPATRLPREKPPPKPRPPTKWEEFAKLKGIQKKKKTNLVWDETAKEWKRRWGYKRVNDGTKEWLIEVPENADPNEDQFAKRTKAKKERVARNEFNRLRNIARAQKVKVPGVGGLTPKAQQSKDELGRAVSVAKTSTASMGRFQEGLPREKPAKSSGKKRKFEPLIGDFSSEKQKQLELLRVMDTKKPKLDITKAVNKQMREEDREEAAAKYKRGAGKKGRRGNMPGKGKGQGGKGRGGGKPGGKPGGGRPGGKPGGGRPGGKPGGKLGGGKGGAGKSAGGGGGGGGKRKGKPGKH